MCWGRTFVFIGGGDECHTSPRVLISAEVAGNAAICHSYPDSRNFSEGFSLDLTRRRPEDVHLDTQLLETSFNAF